MDQKTPDGYTLRDHFAGLALQALLHSRHYRLASDIAEEAYKYADAMLEARKTIRQAM
jgi:hypothetical protein